MDHETASYKYAPLDPSSHVIRLVTILPGQPDDRIDLEITHTILPPADTESVTNKAAIIEIQKTLPPNWYANETLEGRTLFYKENDDGTAMSQWDHPDPSIGSESSNSAEHSDSHQLEYEALSYVWGSSEVHEYAHVVSGDKRSQSSCLGLAKNLSEAIRHLRDSQERKVMWIDAICINQGDVTERSEQIKRMDIVFRRARRVVAWLGPMCRDVDLAFKLISLAGRKIEMFASGGYHVAPGHTMQADGGLMEIGLQSDAATWEAILRVVSMPWFERLWIVQEIWLASPAPVLRCGEAEILWKLFRNGIMVLRFSRYTPSHYLERLYNSEMIGLGDSPSNFTFEELLWDHSARSCSSHHDKIYGLLGVMPRMIAKAIRDTANYTKPVEQVYKEVFLLRAKQSARLDLLQFCPDGDSTSFPTRVPDSRPTWVRSWHVSCNKYVPLHLTTAAGYSPSKFQYIEPDRLEVAAVTIARISTVENPQVNTFSDIVSYFRRTDLRILQKKSDHTGQAMFDAHLYCFLRGFSAEFNDSLGWASFNEVKNYILVNIRQAEGVAPEANVPRIPQWQEHVISSWCPGSAILTSADNIIGIGSSSMQPGK